MTQLAESPRSTTPSRTRPDVTTRLHLTEPGPAPAGDNGACRPLTITNGNRIVEHATGPAHPAQPAEVAQARLFESILHTEVIELQELAYRVSRSSGRRRGAEGVPPSQHLLRIQARIGEARRLLRALQDRFPHPA